MLFQGRLTNLLLWPAEARAFEPVWSAEIHEEWSRNLAASKFGASKFGISPEKLAYRRAQMQRAFPAANCDADPSIVLAVQAVCRLARQRKDAHVVATAIAAEATVIVTDNLRDFAPDVLAAYNLRKAAPRRSVWNSSKHGAMRRSPG